MIKSIYNGFGRFPNYIHISPTGRTKVFPISKDITSKFPEFIKPNKGNFPGALTLLKNSFDRYAILFKLNGRYNSFPRKNFASVYTPAMLQLKAFKNYSRLTRKSIIDVRG